MMKAEDCRISRLFDLKESLAGEYLAGFEYPWQALAGLGDFIRKLGPTLPADEYEERGKNIWIARDAVIAPTVSITGPAIIGHRTEVRQCAFIRGKALVGDDCVVGNSVELKNVILFNRAKAPHFNYVGDAILGVRAHMGAGSITSNMKSDESNIVIHCEDQAIVTGMRKIGAILGDHVEVGCNSVLNPGTVIGPGSTVYPLSMVRGTIPGGCIYKDGGRLVEKNMDI